MRNPIVLRKLTRTLCICEKKHTVYWISYYDWQWFEKKCMLNSIMLHQVLCNNWTSVPWLTSDGLVTINTNTNRKTSTAKLVAHARIQADA